MAEKEEAREEEEEYESDLDDAPLPAVRRRDAASDEDEDGAGGETGSPPPLRAVGPDSDSDGQGAAEPYDDDEEGTEECQVYEEFVAGGGEVKAVVDEVVAAPVNMGKYEVEEVEVKATVEREELKKGAGPCAVPTAGAFYMHDDRFRDEKYRSHGSQRDIFGDQKLWYPKDDGVWVHDRFHERNFHGFQHDHATMRPRGTLKTWGGGRTNGVDHGSFNGTKSRPYLRDDNRNYMYIPKESHTHHNSTESYNGYPKEPNTSYDNVKNYRGVSTNVRSYYDDTKNFDNVRRESHAYYGNAKHYNNTPNVYRCRDSKLHQPHWKNYFEISSEQSNSSLERESCPILKVKASFPSGGHGNAVHSLRSVSIEGIPKPDSYSSMSNNFNQYSKSSYQGTGNIGDLTKNKPFSSTRQATRSYTQPHNNVHQQVSAQQHFPYKPKTSTTIYQEYVITNKIQLHPQTTPANSTEDAKASTPCGSNNSTDPFAEGQNDKEVGSVSFPCDGDHVLGLTGTKDHTLGDTPALSPVIHFNGQHPRGPDISSFGMALQGFVAPQQFGGICEISQMTWLPILTGATGALGATYSTPYFGSYHPQSSEILTSSVSPRDQSANIVPISLKLEEIREIAGHELVQPKNKPRSLLGTRR